MIINKTPYRISFFGGGTDYPNWYLKNGGEVISSTINKYLYLSCRYLPKYFDHSYKIIYSKMELTNKINEIKHPVVRELVKKMKIKKGLELHHDGDLPARSGIGSSSSFVVGCINVLNALQNKNITKKDLANKSLYFEQNILKEIVGSQDQIAASYGGFNSIKFFKNGQFKVDKIKISKKNKEKLSNRLILLYTGVQRTAQNIASKYVKKLNNSKKNQMKDILNFVPKAKLFLKDGKLDDFGDLLDESWQKKKELSKNISNYLIDEIYEKALNNGSLGGKILGAGGGGFFLFYVKSSKINNFKKAFKNYSIINFEFENLGSHIVFNKK